MKFQRLDFHFVWAIPESPFIYRYRREIDGKKDEDDESAWTRVGARNTGDGGKKRVEEVHDGADRSEETAKVEGGRTKVRREQKREGRQPHGIRNGNWRAKEGQRGEEEDREYAVVEDGEVSRSGRTGNREEGRERREERWSDGGGNRKRAEEEERKTEEKRGVGRVVTRPQRMKGLKNNNRIGGKEDEQEERDKERRTVGPAALREKESGKGEEAENTEEPYEQNKRAKEGRRGEKEDRGYVVGENGGGSRSGMTDNRDGGRERRKEGRSNNMRNENRKEVEERKMEVKGWARRVVKRPQRTKRMKDSNWIGSEEEEQEEGDREQEAVEPATQREKGSVEGEELDDTEGWYDQRKWVKEGQRGEEEDRECMGEGGGDSKANVTGDRDGGREGIEERQINNGGNESRVEGEGRRREVKEQMRRTAKGPQGRKGSNQTGGEDDGQKEGDREQGTVELAIQRREDGGKGEELEDIENRRTAAMQLGLKNAVDVPFSLAEKVNSLWPFLKEMAQHGNIACKSDIQVAAKALEAGVFGAYFNVIINLKDITDEDFTQQVHKNISYFLEEAQKNTTVILDHLDKRAI